MGTWTVAVMYDGVVEASSVRLALARIRRFGFPRHEWPRLLQELVLEIMAFEFDPAKVGGATKVTALGCLINRRLTSERRAQHRYEKRIRQLRPEESYGDHVELRVDVRLTVAGLSSREHRVCEGLGRGESVSEIARSLGCGRATVRRLIECIRQHFTALGLRAWVLS